MTNRFYRSDSIIVDKTNTLNNMEIPNFIGMPQMLISLNFNLVKDSTVSFLSS